MPTGGVTLGLNGRARLASLVLAAIVAGAFAAMLLAIDDLRDASREAQRSDQVAAAANELERLVIDLQSGQRGYIITGERRFLEPWTAALHDIPIKERQLSSLLRDPGQQRREQVLASAVADYIRTWAVPTVTLAQTNLAAAIEEVASEVGKKKMDHARAFFGEFLVENSRLTASRRAHAAAAGDRASLYGAVGLVGSALLILVFTGYLTRQVVAPVSRLARAADRLGEGDLTVRVPETGAAEIGGLARTFNRMATSIEANRAELESQNAELDAFSYSVSHDLRAPLRAIDGFSRLLLDEYAGSVPEEGKRYLGRVRESTHKMGMLIDGLLTFSRLGQQQLGKRTVGVEDIAHEVVDDLENERSGRSVAISVGALEPAQADPTLLKQVLTNLVSNALKYTRGRDTATIEIGSNRSAGQVVYFVRDDGVGFDMRYADKLFGVFQRLHRAEDYEGTGLGLALVARIVKRHGGRIWAEAKPNEGATFYFTLDGGEA